MTTLDGSAAHVGDATITDIVDLARLAPSVHNTQPWFWRIVGSTLELHADWDRMLPATDPRGHNLVVSCGAALHHAQIAALALGWVSAVTRLPDGPASDLLARIELTPTPGMSRDIDAIESLRARRSDRRRFTSWPVPDQRLTKLAVAVEHWGVIATPVLDVVQRSQVEALVKEASTIQSQNPVLAREQATWIDHSGQDGVSSAVLPEQLDPEPRERSRFGPGMLEESDPEIESSDGLIVLSTVADNLQAWLQTGEALDALLLDATAAGFTALPISQVIETASTREALQRQVLVSLAVPHAVVRIGWPSINRTPLPPVPRRALEDVLQPVQPDVRERRTS